MKKSTLVSLVAAAIFAAWHWWTLAALAATVSLWQAKKEER